MTTEILETGRGRIPFDIARCAHRAGQFDLVRKVVQGSDWPGKNRDFAFGERIFRAQMLMMLITYCYANAVYDSERIAASLFPALATDYFDARKLPDANMIQRFRRLYRGAIEQCLARVLEEGGRVGSETAAESGFDHRPHAFFVAEAAERVDRAMRLDSFAHDI